MTPPALKRLKDHPWHDDKDSQAAYFLELRKANELNDTKDVYATLWPISFSKALRAQ